MAVYTTWIQRKPHYIIGFDSCEEKIDLFIGPCSREKRKESGASLSRDGIHRMYLPGIERYREECSRYKYNLGS
jgi:hypothetical protein